MQLPYHVVDATCDPDTCLHHAITTLNAAEPWAHPLASRRQDQSPKLDAYGHARLPAGRWVARS
jgi:hypothetical protein